MRDAEQFRIPFNSDYLSLAVLASGLRVWFDIIDLTKSCHTSLPPFTCSLRHSK